MKKFAIYLTVIFFLMPLYGQDSPVDLDSKVQRYIGWMTRDNNPDVWGAAKRLEGLGTRAVPIIKRNIQELPGMAQVGCAKALIELGELDYSFELLLRLVANETDRDVKLKAIEVLGIAGDFELEEKLEKLLEDTLDPYMKIAIAKSLWLSSHNPKATDVLKSFLRVDNTKLQYEAALALGEIQNVEAAKPILSQLSQEPTEQGRLARVLLEYESRMANFERFLDSQGGVNKTDEKSTETKEKFPLIDEVIEKIKTYHVQGDEFGQLELINSAVKGMVNSTDIHSAFWTEKEWSDFVRTTINEAYVGIGIYVGEVDGFFTVISPIYSGPAYRAGIRSMDRVLEVNGWSTTNKSVDDIIKHIKGDTGTTVKLKVHRDGWAKSREIEVKREKIRVPSLYAQMLPQNIGYMRLTQFGRKAADDIEKSLTELQKQGMTALVLDLRDNAGGWLKMAVDIVDKFIEANQLIVYSKGRHPEKGKKYEHFSTGKTFPQFPMVVLVNGSSASASEIVAGALQHYKRATIVGIRTYGKGSVQEPIPLDSRPGSRLKLTIARYYLPDGRCIHNEIGKDGNVIKHNGIAPDIEVKNSSDWASWKNEELSNILEKDAFQKYINQYYSENEKLFAQLADNDNLSTQFYPGFDEWYESLRTKASKQDVRYWLREKIRRKISDVKGQEYACDYLEDDILQRGILELLGKLKLNARDVSEYKVFADKFKD